MSKRVLDVGNCDPDHASLTSFLKKHFDVSIDRAKLPAEAISAAQANAYDLVVVNRKLDEDYSDGLEVVRQFQADAKLKQLPIMLITNYAEHQEAAMKEGALYGFGKLEYSDPAVIARIGDVLGK